MLIVASITTGKINAKLMRRYTKIKKCVSIGRNHLHGNIIKLMTMAPTTFETCKVSRGCASLESYTELW